MTFYVGNVLGNMRFFLHVNVQYMLITYLICISYLWVRVFWLTLIRSSAVREPQGRRHYNDNEAHINPPSILQFLMWWFSDIIHFFLVYQAAYRCPKTCCFYWKKLGTPILIQSHIEFYWCIFLVNFEFKSPNNIYIYTYVQCLTSSSPYYLYVIFSLPIHQSIRPSSPSRWDLWKRFHVPQMVGLTYGDFVLFLWSKLLDHIFWWGCNGCH